MSTKKMEERAALLDMENILHQALRSIPPEQLGIYVRDHVFSIARVIDMAQKHFQASHQEKCS